MIVDIELLYREIISKTNLYWQKNRHINQYNGISRIKVTQLKLAIIGKDIKNKNKGDSFKKWYRKTGYSSYTKIN